MKSWGFLTNHAHVLIQIARDPTSTVREIAAATGITERATHSVLNDLRAERVVESTRSGRKNTYRIDVEKLVNGSRWSASDVEIPRPLIDATLRGLATVTNGNSEAFQPFVTNPPEEVPPPATKRWGFLTTQALVLIHVTQHPHSTVRDIASAVGVTERSAHSVLGDLRDARIVVAERSGRRNSYTVSFEHLAAFRREGTAPELVPDSFVSALTDGLLPLQMPDYASFEDEPHPIN